MSKANFGNMKVLIASTNLNKAKELKAVAEEFGINLILPSELGKEIPNVIEDGATYFENALIKAEAFHKWSNGMPVISDDSGLEVEILKNAPGIYSARYGGEISQKEKNLKIIEEVKIAEQKLGKKNRNARFFCTVLLYFSKEQYFFEDGILEGKVLDIPQGQGGFGYDPIILINSLDKTLSEIDFSITTKVGFRSIAVRKLFNKLALIKSL